MKSDCCNWECIGCGDRGYESPDLFFEHLKNCEKYQKQKKEVPKLTPAQVKAIRWPSEEQLDLWMGKACNVRDFPLAVIRYALKDLMGEGE